MKVNILLFATLRDYIGLSSVEIELPEGSTVKDLKEILANRYHQLKPAKTSIMAAINREFATDEQVIPMNAEIALFPPVSGG